MIYLPPNPSVIIDRISSTLKFMLKKKQALHCFFFNVKEFWNSFWILFLLNGLQNVFTVIAIQKILKLQDDSLTIKVIILTCVQICFYSIIINRILIIRKKEEFFLKYLIPFYWMQSTNLILSLILGILGLLFPPFFILFLKFNLIIWLLFSVWRLGKQELNFSNLEIISYIGLYYVVYFMTLIFFLGFFSPLKVN